MNHVLTFPLTDVLITSDVSPDQLPTNIPFLNIRFSANAAGVNAATMIGPGLYAISYKTPECSVPRVIYIGKYLGKRGNPFSGNVAKLRWWTHAGSFTMRGQKVHIARKTAMTLALELPSPSHSFVRLLEPSADVFKDRGNQAGLNRVRFAMANWEQFGRASAGSILNGFFVTYLRLPHSRLSFGEVRGELSKAESELIRELQPIGNGGIKHGRMPPESEFVGRCQHVLETLV